MLKSYLYPFNSLTNAITACQLTKKIIVIIVLVVFFSVCTDAQSLKLLAEFKKTEPVVKPLKAKGKEVYFIEMRHLAKPAFYDNVKLIVDSFISNNYVVYTEGIGTGKRDRDLNDSLTLKKLRKILNLDITASYTELGPYKFFVKKHGLIFQPKFYDSAKASHFKHVDLTYNDLIQPFEKRYGEIILDSCDLSNDLGQSSYPCLSLGKKQRKIFAKEFVMKARNEHVAQTIINSNDSKVLIMYGEGHYKGLKKSLRKIKK